MPGDLYITADAAADRLLNDDPNALLIGMLLDQQIPLEWAFLGPATLRERLGHLDPGRIATMDVDDLVEVACRTPAIHRFPAVMARRLHALCNVLVRDHRGSASSLWADGPDGAVLHRRLLALPGFGDEKSKIFIALLAKRQGVAVPGWEISAGVFADDQPRSIADTHDAASLSAVRAWKAAQKAVGKDKQDRPVPKPAVTRG
ncbi:MAG: HhH-GPD-type base excision DNA repair protein, partial [Ilumatobacteraceae bacterium]